MAYKRYRGDERIFRGLFRVKIMVNREGQVEADGEWLESGRDKYRIKFIYSRFIYEGLFSLMRVCSAY